jgi:adenosine deaminase
MDFRSLPKIEMHCHLDASVRVETVAELASKTGLAIPEQIEQCLVAPPVCEDLADYLRRIDLAVDVMQHPDHLTRIAAEFVEDLVADGVVYGEVRFAPQLHTRHGLSLQQVLDAVHEGLSSRPGARTGLIVCCLRHDPPSLSEQIAQLAVDNPDKVCALDLAGDEARYPGAPHAKAFQIARKAGVHVTVHAGEAAGAESIREALDVLGAERIGHGVRIEEDAGLVDRVRDQRISLDMCPLSNVQTRATHSLATHPIDRLLRRGLRVTVSTDARTVSDTTVSKEFDRLTAQFGWTLEEFWTCQRNAAEAAFVSEGFRQELLNMINWPRNVTEPADLRLSGGDSRSDVV